MDRLSHVLEWAKRPEVIARMDQREAEGRANSNKRRSKYIKKRCSVDQAFVDLLSIRAKTSHVTRLKGNKKFYKSTEIIGCTPAELKEYLISKFTQGMKWELVIFGIIEIDHIRPCASFDLSDPEQQKVCFHYTNLQPLWHQDNRKKNSFWDGSYWRMGKRVDSLRNTCYDTL